MKWLFTSWSLKIDLASLFSVSSIKLLCLKGSWKPAYTKSIKGKPREVCFSLKMQGTVHTDDCLEFKFKFMTIQITD